MKLGIISPRVLIRRALSTLLASTGTGLVVVEGSNLHDCLDEVKLSQPDMLIVDVGVRGLESLPDLTRLDLIPKVVVLMDDLDNASLARAFQLGVWGCLSTRQSPMAFQKALASVSRGERWMPQQVVINEIVGSRNQAPDVPGRLTPREWEVFGLMANGFRNKEISSRLNICEETAKSHVKSIYRKLKIKGRRDAMFRYFEFVHRMATKEDVDAATSADPPA